MKHRYLKNVSTLSLSQKNAAAAADGRKFVPLEFSA
jgi:hypothetical protein